MAVVAFRRVEAARVRSQSISVWFVQTLWPQGGTTPLGRKERFFSQEAALRAGKKAAGRAGEAIVYKVQGDPESDLWGTPLMIARYSGAS